jgi:hypothetical protein
MLGALWSRLDLYTFFSIFTSLASRGVMGKLGTIVLLLGCGDGIFVSILMGAPFGGRSMTDVCPCLVTVVLVVVGGVLSLCGFGC